MIETANHQHERNIEECRRQKRLRNLREMADWEKHYMLAYLSGYDPDAFDATYAEAMRLRKADREAALERKRNGL